MEKYMSVKVSICIPTYNNVDEVEKLLRSIYMQKYTDFDVHISDDSTNVEIEKMVRQSFKQVDYRHNASPLGHIFNWNAALAMGEGEYIKIMFSDDWFTTEESLGMFVAMLDHHPEADLAFCGSRQVNLTDGSCYDRHAEASFIKGLEADYRHLFLGNQIGAPSAIIFRNSEERAWFDEKSNWASDMFLYFDILSQNDNFAYTTEPLISIGVHENQYTETFSDQDERIYLDYKYMFEKYELVKAKECRQFLLRKYHIPFGRKKREALQIGIPAGEYRKAKVENFLASCKCFLESRWKSLSNS